MATRRTRLEVASPRPGQSRKSSAPGAKSVDVHELFLVRLCCGFVQLDQDLAAARNGHKEKIHARSIRSRSRFRINGRDPKFFLQNLSSLIHIGAPKLYLLHA